MKRLLVILQMIKVEHTVFALPFAFLGAFLAARGFPGWETSAWILLAMTAARSAAMAFNRLIDVQYDAQNPRTSTRALPQGLLTPVSVGIFVVFSAFIFFLAAWKLNPLALKLSPLALGIILFYSYTKRFTSLSHLVLGLSLAIAPAGGWIAVRGSLDWSPLYLSAAVLFWVAGFDIIYACQDVEFDRRSGLRSIPATLGIRTALWIAALLHVVMMLFLLRALYVFDLSVLSWVGFTLVAAGLIYEHSLVKPEDLSRVNAAFFTANGFISMVLFVAVGLDLCLFA